jgi:hypothetical protein
MYMNELASTKVVSSTFLFWPRNKNLNRFKKQNFHKKLVSQQKIVCMYVC